MNPTKPPTLDYDSARPKRLRDRDWVYGFMVVGVVLLCMFGIMLVLIGVFRLIICKFNSDACGAIGALLCVAFGFICIAPSVSLVRMKIRRRGNGEP